MTDGEVAEQFRILPYSKDMGRLRRFFNCGVEVLNCYLKSQASQDMKKRASTLFVALSPKETSIVGFYTLAMYSVDVHLVPESLKEKLPKYPMIPAILLGRLAVDCRFQGEGIGECLLIDAMKRALNNDVAWWAMLVQAKERALPFYRRYGFLPLQDSPNYLFLPYLTICQALSR